MKRTWILALALVTGVTFFGAHPAAASKSDPNDPNNPDVTRQCVADARATQRTCNQTCKDDFLTAVDTCRNVNHDCADTARENRDTCVKGVFDALNQCISTECAQFDTDIDQCRTDFPAHSADRAVCINNAQLQKFICRKNCRLSTDVFKGLRDCRDTFKTDIQACKEPAPTPTSMGK
ncbi:MAG TPA: hypothetical protein VMR86_09430 [Myxococcota bacterium]|nr:hypothetical protein [Myxococcota bacterium]